MPKTPQSNPNPRPRPNPTSQPAPAKAKSKKPAIVVVIQAMQDALDAGQTANNAARDASRLHDLLRPYVTSDRQAKDLARNAQRKCVAAMTAAAATTTTAKDLNAAKGTVNEAMAMANAQTATIAALTAANEVNQAAQEADDYLNHGNLPGGSQVQPGQSPPLPQPQPAPSPRPTRNGWPWKTILFIFAILCFGFFFYSKKTGGATSDNQLVTCLGSLDKTLQNGIKLGKVDSDRLDFIAKGTHRINQRVEDLTVMVLQTSDTLKTLLGKKSALVKGKKPAVEIGLLASTSKTTTKPAETTKLTLEGLSGRVDRIASREEARDQAALLATGMSPEQAKKALHDGNYQSELAAWESGLNKAANSASIQSVNELSGQVTELENRVRTQEVEIINLRGETIKVTQRVASADDFLGCSIQRLKTVGRFGSPKKALKDMRSPDSSRAVPSPPPRSYRGTR